MENLLQNDVCDVVSSEILPQKDTDDQIPLNMSPSPLPATCSKVCNNNYFSEYFVRCVLSIIYNLILQLKSVYDSPLLSENKYKKTFCPYCESLQDSHHFFRHLVRNYT